ncbi:hypothetical protein HPP92_024845 [Vanilla planifolia]|uniref:Uncharacterized protein n=1 Tax=Vanilla planifolia TaxID=51239 RepID=A0A835PQM1_VANPL|nr:hypothetical protein HPP92_024845 [Vanilla planifolia]
MSTLLVGFPLFLRIKHHRPADSAPSQTLPGNRRICLSAASKEMNLPLTNVYSTRWVSPVSSHQASSSCRLCSFANPSRKPQDLPLRRKCLAFLWPSAHRKLPASHLGGRVHPILAFFSSEEEVFEPEGGAEGGCEAFDWAAEEDLVEQLELVDSLRQLGVDYHFRLEIEGFLSSLVGSLTGRVSDEIGDDLHSTALLFRLLREYGIGHSQPSVDVIQSCFKETKASLKAGNEADIKGLLSLYEAAFLVVEGEDEVDEAREFVVEHLGNLRRSNSLRNPLLAEQIDHALELPLHWRMPRMHTRWFIDHYARKEDYIPALLEFAILDFNLVQSIYKEELQEMSRWWRSLDLVCDDLHFIRDRLVENYLWAAGFSFLPELGRCRTANTKMNCFITTIDDVYDIYGTLEELELFTDAVKEWKITESKELPHYMKIILVTLFNTIEDIAHTYYEEKGLDVLSCLKQVWVDLCKSYMVEARWYYTGYIPTFDEYLENAWISSSGVIGLTVAYCLSQDFMANSFQDLEFYRDTVQLSCTLFRFHNDLVTSRAEIKRGDTPKSIECYMKEKNVSEWIAREGIAS